MRAFAAPIIPGQKEHWESWIGELTGTRKAELEDMNERHGLTAHHAWLQETPDGQHMAVVVYDGPGAETFLREVGASEHGFDVWFRDNVAQIHGMDMKAPPPLPEQFL
jgi:hypothetical protein